MVSIRHHAIIVPGSMLPSPLDKIRSFVPLSCPVDDSHTMRHAAKHTPDVTIDQRVPPTEMVRSMYRIITLYVNQTVTNHYCIASPYEYGTRISNHCDIMIPSCNYDRTAHHVIGVGLSYYHRNIIELSIYPTMLRTTALAYYDITVALLYYHIVVYWYDTTYHDTTFRQNMACDIMLTCPGRSET